MTRPVVSSRLFALILAGGSFLALTAPAVHADEPAAPAAPSVPGMARLNIAPLRLELDAAKPAATVMLTNTSDRPVPVQTRLFAWSQEGGEDHFTPSSALTISPAIVAIQPGATQIVRLLRTGAASPGEKRFRLAVDQLPDPTLAQSGSAEARLRFTIPVFLDRDTAAPAQLDWRIGADTIEVGNAGGATARIVSIEVKTAAGKVVPVQRNSLRYVQGSSAIAWPIANGCALGPVTIVAQVDGRMANVQASPVCG
ncbi:molecular chaperone [Novosphingobium sp. Gsoil 351]|uniref:fimbrial biogenesis chaperone n=1 Tax=Novosphingobium sp. Gsoil 351 TaxID=2675225 RepID=UPI0012B44CD6|nr:fimbria/pilus periplasmic chaperone [Novosphingobium sp. Gsoil 351]QGN54897.1 fimbria/pilus periplasmic chaperone [Novosphingobium sp. Gsoil 351]